MTTQVATAAEVALFASEKIRNNPPYRCSTETVAVIHRDGAGVHVGGNAHVLRAAHISIRVWDDDGTVQAMLADRHGDGVGPEMTFTGLPSSLAADAIALWTDSAEEIIRSS